MNKKILLTLSLLAILFIIYACEKEVFTGIIENESFVYTKIFVNSNPQDVKIFVDGRNMGLTTPDTVKWLSEGTHQVTLKGNYFIDTSFVVTTQVGSVPSFDINYHNSHAQYGRMECRSEPTGADVYINDVKQDQITTCIVTDLFAGKYKVKYSLKDYRDDSLEVDIYGSRITKIHLTLEDTSAWVIYNTTNSRLIGDNAVGVLTDNNDVKWVAAENGVSKFVINNWVTPTELNIALENKTVKCITCDNSNNIWVGTNDGLLSYNNGQVSNYSLELPSKNINDLDVFNNQLWIATDNGLVKYDGAWTIYNTSNSGISRNFITSVKVASDGAVWCGTEAGGINKFYNDSWIIYDSSNLGLSQFVGNTINDLTVDNFGNVFVAHRSIPREYENESETGGLTEFDGISWKIIQLKNIPQQQIQKLYTDDNGYLWICTKSGLGKYNINTGSLVTFTKDYSKLPDYSVTDIIIDGNNDLWLTTFGGGALKLKKGNY